MSQGFPLPKTVPAISDFISETSKLVLITTDENNNRYEVDLDALIGTLATEGKIESRDPNSNSTTSIESSLTKSKIKFLTSIGSFADITVNYNGIVGRTRMALNMSLPNGDTSTDNGVLILEKDRNDTNIAVLNSDITINNNVNVTNTVTTQNTVTETLKLGSNSLVLSSKALTINIPTTLNLGTANYNFAHGLDGSKIVDVLISIKGRSRNEYYPRDTDIYYSEFFTYWDNTNLKLRLNSFRSQELRGVQATAVIIYRAD